MLHRTVQYEEQNFLEQYSTLGRESGHIQEKIMDHTKGRADKYSQRPNNN